ncbi:MAG: hypothetical protein Q9187_005731 [Circinaria calcarea]
MAATQPSKQDDDVSNALKKPKQGFQVGPNNLPDGTHRRKVQKIKKDLIHKAKIKQSYAKLKKRELINRSVPSGYSREEEDAASPTTKLHPARQAMLDEPEKELPQLNGQTSSQSSGIVKRRRPKPIPFVKEAKAADRKRKEAEARYKAIEEAKRQRQQKIEERERFRRQMAKARTGGQNGQRKLGRESQVLLERVKKIVSE